MIDVIVCVVEIFVEYCDLIDCLDVIFVYILGECFKYIQVVGKFKVEYVLFLFDFVCESLQIVWFENLVKEVDLDFDFVKVFFNFIIGEVIRYYKKYQE